MTSAVLTVLFLIKQRHTRLAESPDYRPGSLGNLAARLPVRRDARQGRLPDRRVRVPALHRRGHLRRDLGRGGMGPLLGLGPQGDLGVHRLGRLRVLPARPRDCRLEGQGRCVVNLLGFGAITFNFLVVNIVVSGLHSYAGLS